MIALPYADFAWEKTAQLLSIDSPSGFTARAARWVCSEFQLLGFNAWLTEKGGVLVDFGGEDRGTACFWRPTPTPWAAWSARSSPLAA